MIRADVSGETVIFRNDKGFYSAGLSKKNQEGGYDNAYINVSFKKGTEIPNKTKINIKNGFLTFDNFTNKDGKNVTSFKIFVMDYEIPGDVTPTEFSNNTDDDDLPF